jgi:hypothetical protein
MTISNNRAAGQAGATKHSSLSLCALAAMAAGLLCVALPPLAARAAGNGLQSGITCPAAAPYRIYVYGVWRCYECDRDTLPEECEKRKAANRAARRSWKDLRNPKIPCRNAPCSPGAAAAKREGISSGAVDRLSGDGAPRAPLGGGQSGGGPGTRSSASGAASSATSSGGGTSAPSIGTNTIMRAGGSTPGQTQSPGLR